MVEREYSLNKKSRAEKSKNCNLEDADKNSNRYDHHADKDSYQHNSRADSLGQK